MLQFLKRSFFTLFFLGMALHMSAQDQQYFVYIQSERSQSFYVRYDGKLLPSSDKGYLILSKMPAGTASLRIGFAKSDAPEREYQVRITGPADQGFLLKQDGDRGYALFNLQTFAVTRPATAKQKETAAVTEAPAQDAAVATEQAPAPVPVAEVATTTPAPEVVTAPATAAADTPLIPAPPVPAVSEEEKNQKMMASLKKDLDSTFPAKSGATVGPGTRPVNPVTPPPVKQTNKFSQALDRVVSDDRPDEIEPEQPKAPATAAVPADSAKKVVPAEVVTEAPKKKRKRREREPLTEEEQQLASAILAEENKDAAPAPATVAPATTETPAPAPVQDTPAAVPVAETTPAAIPAEPVKEETSSKKDKKSRKKKADDPAFIDFMDTGGHQAPPAGTPVPAATTETPAPAPVVIPAEDPAAGTKKKKRSKLAEKIDTIDTSERPNNVVNDPTGYEVSDLSIDHPKESRKDKKKKKDGEEIAPAVVAPVAEPVTDTKSSSALKMINSDCGKVMDDETFRKVLKKFAASKDDDAMIESFRKQTKGYCLESSQIRTMVQLMSNDESKYRLLDQAYPKAYHSDEFPGMENLLSDKYYRGRFKAMLHR
ncbi:hypothetical protein [Chitinophaga pinensis]|uniref:DUF4476 domain-containing protein n=1 Tax=Chitinophaga pinensis TaxID=79329 RepID=A0A5C6LMW5_9BACT|nr:hypothetical protein [Chitinophaga pinensis]TWV88679.1 hypothetical protein FEF09_30480 [Chitinophaga pinensis]